jgi:DNA transformation protein
MAKPTEFVLHVLETMRRFGPVEAKPMFGGWGLYHQGLFFALIADDALCLKADDANVAEFKRAGLKPFVYAMKSGETMTLHYYHAPEEALEDAEVMAKWARSAYGAALRKAAAKGKPRKAAPRAAASPATPPKSRRKARAAKRRS